ncbi:hypothetical protein NL676_006896 [Syzygium grande]|nr:hypothetical protein NL676_006896 [Syzygium grande]
MAVDGRAVVVSSPSISSASAVSPSRPGVGSASPLQGPPAPPLRRQARAAFLGEGRAPSRAGRPFVVPCGEPPRQSGTSFRRYSTNTCPRWPLAQPMRFLGHNGEINTIQGNWNRMQSCENSLKSPIWHGRENEIRPFGNPKASDSANLDSAAEVRYLKIIEKTGYQALP